MCKNIAEEVEKYASGEMYNYNGDKYCADDLSDEQLEEAEQLGLYDYFENALDIKYICNSNREVEDIRILVAFGGPNIWIDTESSKVELSWWNESADYAIDETAVDAIRDWAVEMFNL